MRSAFLTALALTTGCVAGPPPESVGSVVEPLRICAEGPTVRGIDVSHWQATIDWDAVVTDAADIRFAIVRVSDGVGTMDREFHRNWAEARRVGLLRGAYQFFRPGSDPLAQADLFLREVTLEEDDLPPVLDVEADGGLSASQVQDAIRIWVDRVEAATGREAMIYTARFFWRDQVGNSSEWTTRPLWIANYGVSCPDVPTAWDGWRFWQDSSTGTVAGIDGNVDTNFYNGTLDELLTFAGSAVCTPTCEGGVAVGEDCRRQDCAALGATCTVDGGVAGCAADGCPAVGEASFCSDGLTLVRCDAGASVDIDCSGDGGICSAAGLGPGAARCVSTLCVSAADVAPVAHDGCTAGGELVHCGADGIGVTEACAAGLECRLDGSTASCVDATLAPPPDMGMGMASTGGCAVASTGHGGSVSWLVVGLALVALGRRRR